MNGARPNPWQRALAVVVALQLLGTGALCMAALGSDQPWPRRLLLVGAGVLLVVDARRSLLVLRRLRRRAAPRALRARVAAWSRRLVAVFEAVATDEAERERAWRR